jgi:putative Ca2+/H+ antiporter (TMEM165/GDT1 family)
MDALIPAFIVAALAELGDRTQLLAILLGTRFRSPAAVIAGIAIAALATMALGAAAGAAAAAAVSHRALQLMTGLALLLAGAGGFFGVKAAPPIDGWRLGALASSAGAFFILEFGDKTQFVTAAIAGGSGRPVLTAIGAAAGVAIGNVPAVVLGERWPKLVPLRLIRGIVGAVLVLAGLAMALRALQIG